MTMFKKHNMSIVICGETVLGSSGARVDVCLMFVEKNASITFQNNLLHDDTSSLRDHINISILTRYLLQLVHILRLKR